MKISYWVILCDGLFEAYLVTGLVGLPFGRLHFSKSPVDEFELDTSVFVDVVQVGEDFFDIGFEVLYFLFQAVEAQLAGEVVISWRTATKARMMAMLTSMAVSLFSTPESMASPCSVKA
mgnify:CR=1 FL=1